MRHHGTRNPLKPEKQKKYILELVFKRFLSTLNTSYILLFIFLWVRATLPRFRYDQLMRLGWKVFLPLSLLWVILTATFLIFFGLLPNYES